MAEFATFMSAKGHAGHTGYAGTGLVGNMALNLGFVDIQWPLMDVGVWLLVMRLGMVVLWF